MLLLVSRCSSVLLSRLFLHRLFSTTYQSFLPITSLHGLHSFARHSRGYCIEDRVPRSPCHPFSFSHIREICRARHAFLSSGLPYSSPIRAAMPSKGKGKGKKSSSHSPDAIVEPKVKWRLLQISCSKCQEVLFMYRKGGKGGLVKCYLDRIPLCGDWDANKNPTSSLSTVLVEQESQALPIEYSSETEDFTCRTCGSVIGRMLEKVGKPVIKLAGGKVDSQ